MTRESDELKKVGMNFQLADEKLEHTETYQNRGCFFPALLALICGIVVFIGLCYAYAWFIPMIIKKFGNG